MNQQSYTLTSNEYAHYKVALGLVENDFNHIVDSLPTLLEAINPSLLAEFMQDAISRKAYEREELNYALKHGTTLKCELCEIYS